MHQDAARLSQSNQSMHPFVSPVTVFLASLAVLIVLTIVVCWLVTRR